jgi:hypothetical protein
VLQRQVCANHPERPALALCMACGRRLCQECATPWEGIHFCAACLAARRGSGRERGRLLAWLPPLAVAALLFLAAKELRVVLAVLLGGMF